MKIDLDWMFFQVEDRSNTKQGSSSSPVFSSMCFIFTIETSELVGGGGKPRLSLPQYINSCKCVHCFLLPFSHSQNTSQCKHGFHSYRYYNLFKEIGWPMSKVKCSDNAIYDSQMIGIKI